MAEIAVERFGTLAVVGLTCVVKAAEIARLDEKLASHRDAELVVLDCSITSEFESAAVGAIARLLARAGARGLHLRFFNLRRGVRALLEIQFSRYLPMVSLDEVMGFLNDRNSGAPGLVYTDSPAIKNYGAAA